MPDPARDDKAFRPVWRPDDATPDPGDDPTSYEQLRRDGGDPAHSSVQVPARQIAASPITAVQPAAHGCGS